MPTAPWVRLPLAQIKPNPNNPRLIKDDKFRKLVQSIKDFPEMLELRPIVVDGDGVVLGGNMRLKAAKDAGLKDVPVIRAEHLTPDQQREFIVKDNVGFGEWDWDDLANNWNADDLDRWGLDVPAIQTEATTGLTDPDDVPEAPKEPITKPGDRIVLGRHTLMCGDGTSFDDVEKLLNGAQVQMVYTDPPYGINIVKGGWVGGGEANAIPFGGVKGKESQAQRAERLAKKHSTGKQERYAQVIGDESTQTAIDAYNLCATLEANVLIFWGGNYYASALPDSSCWLIWDKENNGNFADAELAWTNQSSAVRLFRHMWNGMVKASEQGQRRVHPTQKPIALAEWCFDLYGNMGDNILDLFGGSGSTLIAAEKTKRSAYIMEMSPQYCDVIVRRWEEFTGQKAIREQRESSDA